MDLKSIDYYKELVNKKRSCISFKVIVDIVAGILLLIIFFPIMILIGILVKLTSKGPILYRERRIGKDEKEFIIYKFRSMINDENHPDYQKYLKESSVCIEWNNI